MKQKKIKSPLRYPGGKSRVADKLVSLFPPHTEYREPFLGGGSVLISERVHNPLKFYWVNDIYNELMSFWICARDHNRELVDIVSKIKSEAEDGKTLHRRLVGSISSMGKLEKAAAFFVINRISFSGTTLSGGFSKSAFEGRFTDSSIRRVEAIAPILKGVGMTQVDYSELLSAEGDDVFIFMDPPLCKSGEERIVREERFNTQGIRPRAFRRELQEVPTPVAYNLRRLRQGEGTL